MVAWMRAEGKEASGVVIDLFGHMNLLHINESNNRKEINRGTPLIHP
jgi:hypothetical protein